MPWLFGDSTAFPLDCDFVEVASDLVETAVAILQIDEEVETIQQQVDGEVSSAERGTAGLDGLAAVVAATIETHKNRTESSFVGSIASRLMEETRAVVEAARREALSRGGMAKAEAQSKVNARRARLDGILERFLLKHELPGTNWGLVWSCVAAETRADAQAVATTPVGIEANFELAIRGGHPWGSTIRVGDLRPGLSISFPKRGRFSSEPRLREEKLDRYHITEVNLAPSRALLTVRKTLKPSAPGFEISLRDTGQSIPTVRAIDDPTRPEGTVPPDTAELVPLEELWQAIELGLRPLIAERVRLVESSLDDVAVTAVDPPARLASALIDSFADLVRELRRRSPVAGELSLKRPLETGRREEVFLPVSSLDGMISALTPARRALFDALGLHAPPPVRADMFDVAATQVTPMRPPKSSRSTR